MVGSILLPQQKLNVGKKNPKLSRLLLFCAIAFPIFLFTGCARYEIKNVDSGGKDIICFGNSITAGLGVSEEESYPRVLSELFGQPVINAGSSADASSDGLRRLEKDVLSHQPRMVIIEFGGNDFLRRLPLEQTINNIQQMIERIQARGAMAAIADVSSGIIMSNYRKSYKKLARQMQAIFIPNLLKGIIDKPSLKSDYIHPNAEGHRIIAERIYQAVKPYLR